MLFSGVHREPGPDLRTRAPLLCELASGTRLFRLHSVHRAPLFFGKRATYRFDDPEGKFGVLYVGLDAHCAFVETFGHATGLETIAESTIRERTLTEMVTTRTLRLIDLCESGGLARIGADAGLCSGGHAVAQRWSAALREHPARPDGILYPARHDPARKACAIFECPASTFVCTSAGSLLDAGNVRLLGQMLDCYGFGLMR